ncbi:late control protein [Flavobacterium sp. TAB 87]|uniref:late control protein n=1 Tax=Flavobacterium sp. TAB 87 TaxID=1729581 RepID=UPI00076D2A56|nr:late control protein [Flavobacterium sp. TAB 87]KVV16142.1 Phage protein D [Flavobacterium sp. TAB 87]
MYILDGKVEIGEYVFNAVHGIEITKSVDDLSDTALIKLPSRFKIRQNGVQKYTEEAIKVGDKVIITLAYEGIYEGVEFTGFVKKISPKTPVEIQCEDAMWLLRRNNINISWAKTSIKEIVQEVIKGTPIEMSRFMKGQDIPLNKWTVRNANGAQVLESLRKDLAQTVFIDDEGKLYVGLQQLTNIGETVVYDLNYNLVENNLEFKSANERRIKIKYNYIDPKTNKKESVEFGDMDGEQREYTTSVVSDKKQLEKMANAELAKMKYDGFDGDVVSFLVPFATRGMKAKLIDEEHPNREGNYFIKKVVTSFDTGGARRKVTLGSRL